MRPSDIPLRHLPVLLVDVQATGPKPPDGHPIDIAWCVASAAADDEAIEAGICASHVALPEGATLPGRVRRLTGIDDDTLADAPAASIVAQQLRGALTGAPVAVAVAHWARYETPHLEALLGEDCPSFVCTHALAGRLLPGLPRRGLRAVAGYLGHPLGELRSAAAHVAATARIWRDLVARLDDELGVVDLEGLRAWLADTSTTRSEKLSYRLPRQTRLGLPKLPGVYRMLGRDGTVLYVGKASCLKDRVNSYFRTRRSGSRRTLELVSQVWDLDVTTCGSALEAALLESDEIKRLAPPYNEQLRRRERKVWFADPQSPADCAAEPCTRRTLGPLPSPRAMQELGALHAWLHGAPLEVALFHVDEGEEDADALLAIAAEGLRLFQESWEVAADIAPPDLLELGRMMGPPAAAEHDQDDEDDEDDEIEAVDEEVWTAEHIARRLERLVHRAHRQAERARWLLRLTDATLAFQPHHDPAALRQVIVEAGRVVAADDATSLEPPPPTPATRADDARRALFDVATYDRLRVLWTELRRIGSEGRPLLLRLDDGDAIDSF